MGHVCILHRLTGARPAGPALQAGLGRAFMFGSFLAGKPRPVGGELHLCWTANDDFVADEPLLLQGRDELARVLAGVLGHILGLIAELIDADPVSIPVRETWGDGLFLAFVDPGEAAMFALNLRDAMAKKDWQAQGFSQPLMMRFALHAGPVQLTVDPITRLSKCVGAHVARAARLEPKTPPGLVYASEAFAALAMLNPIRSFRCDYVKQLDWAKRYGTFPAYVVRRH